MNLPIYNHTITSLLWNRKQAFAIANRCLSASRSKPFVCLCVVSISIAIAVHSALLFGRVLVLVHNLSRSISRWLLLYNQMHMASLCSAFDTAHLDVLSNHRVCIYVRILFTFATSTRQGGKAPMKIFAFIDIEAEQQHATAWLWICRYLPCFQIVVCWMIECWRVLTLWWNVCVRVCELGIENQNRAHNKMKRPEQKPQRRWKVLCVDSQSLVSMHIWVES